MRDGPPVPAPQPSTRDHQRRSVPKLHTPAVVVIPSGNLGEKRRKRKPSFHYFSNCWVTYTPPQCDLAAWLVTTDAVIFRWVVTCPKSELHTACPIYILSERAPVCVFVCPDRRLLHPKQIRTNDFIQQQNGDSLVSIMHLLKWEISYMWFSLENNYPSCCWCRSKGKNNTLEKIAQK